MMFSCSKTILTVVGLASLTNAQFALRGVPLDDRNLQAAETNSTESNIVGGTQQTEKVGFFVHFGDQRCGGTLIAPDMVLTAAHCCDNGFPSTVRVGPLTDTDGVTFNVDAGNSAFHPFWTGNLLNGYDVAVMKLTANSAEAPVALNDCCNNPCFQESMRAYGFGATSGSGGGGSDVLKTLDTTYRMLGSTTAVLRSFADSSSGVCFGDSGGPVLSQANIQYGVASFVQGGCAQGEPDGFARVSTYYSWIRKQVCSKSTDASGFDCGVCGAARDVVRGAAIGVFGLGRSVFDGAATLVGNGPEPFTDVEVWPMGPGEN